MWPAEDLFGGTEFIFVLCPLQRKWRVLTTGPPRNSQNCCDFWQITSFFFLSVYVIPCHKSFIFFQDMLERSTLICEAGEPGEHTVDRTSLLIWLQNIKMPMTGWKGAFRDILLNSKFPDMLLEPTTISAWGLVSELNCEYVSHICQLLGVVWSLQVLGGRSWASVYRPSCLLPLAASSIPNPSSSTEIKAAPSTIQSHCWKSHSDAAASCWLGLGVVPGQRFRKGKLPKAGLSLWSRRCPWLASILRARRAASMDGDSASSQNCWAKTWRLCSERRG